jgi:hypothetical protein
LPFIASSFGAVWLKKLAGSSSWVLVIAKPEPISAPRLVKDSIPYLQITQVINQE